MPRVAARRILLLALGVGIVVDITVPGHQAGLNAVVVMVALLGAACVAAGRDGLRRYDPADAWLPAGAIWLAAMAVIRADSWLVQADLLFAAALAGGTIAALAGARITRGLVPRVLDADGRGRGGGAHGRDRGGAAAGGRGRRRARRRRPTTDARSVTASGRGSPCTGAC